MEKNQIIATGLNDQQASAYVLLLEKGEVLPSAAAQVLGLSRTNAYKVFDKLAEIGIAKKVQAGKKITYQPAHPSALSEYVYQYRAEATAREEAVHTVMSSMLEKYHEYNDKPYVEVLSGKKNVVNAFRKQIGLKEEIFFIHSRSDVAQMGFDTMHEIRTAPNRYDVKRNGIMSEPSGANPKINYPSHERSNLSITWAKKGSYSAPVEWSVTKSSVLIVIYGNDPQAVLVTDKLIAESFLQIWRIIQSLLVKQPVHKKLSQKT
ncbi:hypothetical protein BH23PAT2_BH23PAT2_03630 [soil metagenome]